MRELKTNEVEQVSGGVNAYPVTNNKSLPVLRQPTFPILPTPPFQGGPVQAPTGI